MGESGADQVGQASSCLVVSCPGSSRRVTPETWWVVGEWEKWQWRVVNDVCRRSGRWAVVVMVVVVVVVVV